MMNPIIETKNPKTNYTERICVCALIVVIVIVVVIVVVVVLIYTRLLLWTGHRSA